MKKYEVFRLCRDAKTIELIAAQNKEFGFEHQKLITGPDYFDFLDQIIETCEGNYALVVHDDVFLPINIEHKIDKAISDMDKEFGKEGWGVAGNAGVEYFNYEAVRYIKDPHSAVVPNSSRPLPVISIDGNTLLLNLKTIRKNKIKMPKTIRGFHMYDFLLLVECYKAGLVSAVTPALYVVHNSGGNQKDFDQFIVSDVFTSYWKENFINRNIYTINGNIEIKNTIDYLKRNSKDKRKDFYSIIDKAIDSVRKKDSVKTINIITRTQLKRSNSLKRLLDSVKAGSLMPDTNLKIKVILAVNNCTLDEKSLVEVETRLKSDYEGLEINIIFCPEGEHFPRVSSIKKAVQSIESGENEFVWIVDDDDFIFPPSLDDLNKLLTPGTVFIGEASSFSESWDEKKSFPLRSSIQSINYHTNNSYRNFFGENHVPVSAVIYPQLVLKRIFEEYELKGDYFEDYALIFIAQNIASVEMYPVHLVGISVHGNNTIVSTDRARWDYSYATFMSEIVNKGLVKKHNFEIAEKAKRSEGGFGAHGVAEAELNAIKARKIYKIIKGIEKAKRAPRKLKEIKQKSLHSIRRNGLRGFAVTVIKHTYRTKGKVWQFPNSNNEEYHQWIAKNEKWDVSRAHYELENFKYKPLISVIVPVYNVDPKWLDKCVESVLKQQYENWELCLYDDASPSEETRKCLLKWKKVDPRIKVTFGKKNLHISGASNVAIKEAKGEFIALLDNDDEISSDALFEVVKVLNKNKNIDMIYSDEDKLDLDGKRSGPFFKPDWSLDMFLSTMYTCHFGVYRKSIIDKIGGFREGYEGSQDYDLVLRFVEQSKDERIAHIPKILYHWRMIETSTAYNPNSKLYAYEAGKKVVAEFLQRNKIKAQVKDGRSLGFYHVEREIEGSPLVSIVIPFKDNVDYLEKCVDSILKKTSYKNYEIILVDNQSSEEKTKKYLQKIQKNSKIRVLNFNKPFNYSAINNFAVSEAKGKYILFLNNDTKVINEDWLSRMLEQAEREEVGAVGALLLFPDKTIQHAGVVIQENVSPVHVYYGISINSKGYVDLMDVIRDYSAVTAACMMIRKNLFEKVGGFDEKDFAIAYNDIDLCLKLRKEGYKIIYTPYARLYHYAGKTRGDDDELREKNPKRYAQFVQEKKNLKDKWLEYIPNDPFYNPNLK